MLLAIKPIALIDEILVEGAVMFIFFCDKNATAMLFLCTYLPFSKIIKVKFMIFYRVYKWSHLCPFYNRSHLSVF